jgi:hypothetical protein
MFGWDCVKMPPKSKSKDTGTAFHIVGALALALGLL